jgi:hypothetical protein
MPKTNLAGKKKKLFWRPDKTTSLYYEFIPDKLENYEFILGNYEFIVQV